MRTVRIYGMASNLSEAPSVEPGIEVWCCNNPKRAYNKYRPQALSEYTRWFNMHSERHMRTAYPRGWEWYKEQRKPIVLQRTHDDIPNSVAFPRDRLITHFGHRYFTFSAAWFIALAIYEGFKRIELYGLQLSTRKPLYARERPCFFYWVNEARRRGIEVIYPDIVGTGEEGDPHSYAGPLYGYETT